jgi:hypothetical protein
VVSVHCGAAQSVTRYHREIDAETTNLLQARQKTNKRRKRGE